MVDVMVADDDRAAGQVLRIRLEKAGYGTMAVASGQMAIEQYDAVKPRVVILDAAMPDVSGFDVCQYIRDSDPDRDVKIIFLSGASEPQPGFAERCAVATGGDVFLTKPCDTRRIVDLVAERLGEPVGADS